MNILIMVRGVILAVAFVTVAVQSQAAEVSEQRHVVSSATQFVRLWMTEDYPPEKIDKAVLLEAASDLRFNFPPEYEAVVTEVGLLSATGDLLEAALQKDTDFPVVSDFFKPADIISTTKNWQSIGLPNDLIAFASDDLGNLFCFRRDGRSGVWFYNHDFDEVSKVSASFGAWLDTQNKLKDPN
ncbi:SMI1/KNR4 family protein [Asticcacaulis machinosus]|uniref:SMI1/KNR4 family protein n=1 Tax=Asticcacaulis machinosus TaxID=2984211 RepID=A0ABT5HFU7_9CAUL|nr:SMI1/KNR4 family protein [Asticcacaulis machinosus]MDC7675057.1 SMI1/KNR4 family protein [Asticcacaulis machinosus]